MTPLQPSADNPSRGVVDEATWQCNNCRTRFTATDADWKRGFGRCAPACPSCKAFSQFTYPLGAAGLVDKIERMGFSCEGGPLANCTDWHKAKHALQAAALPAASRDVVDEDKLRKLRVAAMVIANLPQLPDYNGSILTIDDDEARRIASDINAVVAALQAAALPAEMSPEFTDTARAALAWVLYHHQGGSSPVGQPIRLALGMGQHDRLSDQQISDAKRWAAIYGKRTSDFHAALPAVPDVPKGWTPDVSNGGQVSVGDASHTPGRKLWHTDPHGRFWTGYTGTRTAQQLMAECESTIRDLRALLASTPAHDQPEGADND